MQKSPTNPWFDGRVEEAVEFHTSQFDDSRITKIARYGDDGPGKTGDIMFVSVQSTGQDFTVINGGPSFPHSPPMSLLVNCEN